MKRCRFHVLHVSGPEASPVPQASQETPTAVFIGGGVAAFLVVIVAVVAVCYNKQKQRNTTQENRYNAGIILAVCRD